MASTYSISIPPLLQPGLRLIERIPMSSDSFGAMCSTLCLVHCIATPFLFLSRGVAACCATAPTWWKSIDFIFLVLSAFAVLFAMKTSSSNPVRLGLFLSWCFLCATLLNEYMEIITQPSYLIVVPAIMLVGFHLYNKRYCHCGCAVCE